MLYLARAASVALAVAAAVPAPAASYPAARPYKLAVQCRLYCVDVRNPDRRVVTDRLPYGDRLRLENRCDFGPCATVVTGYIDADGNLVATRIAFGR
jgi:hypothetical protein